ncbi:MAG: hypothetical protein JWP91_1386 [Fibrobacteres bacterium]|nr:hypothetical protein [Fibrobacterota bacterium]
MKSRSALFLMALGVQLGWPALTLKMVDGKNQPLSGVTCSVIGGAPSSSDATGNLVLSKEASSIRPTQGGVTGGASLSRIPLAMGEKATLTILNVKGQKLLQRTLSLGDRIPFIHPDHGVLIVDISARGYSTRGHFANLGKEMVFEGISVANDPAKVFAKTSAASGMVSIVCSKSGMPSQVYQVQDGATTTIDFSKLELVPLFDGTTKLEPETITETATALVTRFSDRARDRHAREDQFHAYDHYLAHYWDNRTATLQITDEVAKGGKKIRIDQWTLWPLDPKAREFRAWYRGIGTVAEYNHNVSMDVDPNDPLHYFTEITSNARTGKPIAIGDNMEIEVSQFLQKTLANGDTLEGRDNYYGTVFLYIVGGRGMVPWYPVGVFGDANTERENSHPIPEEAWLGGRTTIHQQTSNEPEDPFMELATNMAPQNGQVFVHGRRVHHTNFITGVHDEPGNPVWDTLKAKAGPNYVNTSCTACHHKNGRAIAPAAGTALNQFVVKVGDAAGAPLPNLGSVLQPSRVGGTAEGGVTLSGWTDVGGLRKPEYAFSGAKPSNYSPRIAPQLVGMGLLEAVPEASILAMADPDDADKDGISGKMQVVNDYVTGQPHLGRFGWKAGKVDVTHQVAGALNSDIGVMTSVYPDPDCGSAQTDCGAKGKELADENLKNLVDYISLLGVRARRDWDDATAKEGEALFASTGCASCHTPTLKTGNYHPKAELRNQTIHPFTDLLLHDMGPGLADNLPEGAATGSEWRTAPLWNIGWTAGVSGGEGYLHDGRARTLKEAILWHGGEADATTAKFKALSAGQQDALIKFLKSL